VTKRENRVSFTERESSEEEEQAAYKRLQTPGKNPPIFLASTRKKRNEVSNHGNVTFSHLKLHFR
jgi:hypothetical protein